MHILLMLCRFLAVFCCVLLCFAWFFFITLSDDPTIFLRTPDNSEIPEHSVAAFTCEVSPPDAKVTWYIDDIMIYESAKFEIISHGATRCLTIHDVTGIDDGYYVVKAGSKEAGAYLKVEGEKLQGQDKLNDIIQTIQNYNLRHLKHSNEES